MAISNNDLFELISLLPENAKQSAYDFLKFLTANKTHPDWVEIALMEPEDIALSKEEEKQLRSHSGSVPWEEAMHELDLR